MYQNCYYSIVTLLCKLDITVVIVATVSVCLYFNFTSSIIHVEVVGRGLQALLAKLTELFLHAELLNSLN